MKAWIDKNGDEPNIHIAIEASSAEEASSKWKTLVPLEQFNILTNEQLEAIERRAFQAGFECSGEGWNGEYVGPTARLELKEDLDQRFRYYKASEKERV